MRLLALAMTILLVCGSTAPGVAQPFADTPANHWAYEALAQLAAKGLIQGYPDGTFKGDRTMTRYEMAMVVARLLARIESIKIPPPPGAPPQPEVTKEDADLILQLVNELRAELTDKNVRLAPVEEQLKAVKEKVRNVKISGAVQIRYDVARVASGDPPTASISRRVGESGPDGAPAAI